ncbi:hypothetical protein MBRA1_000098 [Malassezia brasiliensis]|uniref:ATP-dependent DNA ligase family profile domain-containing protein n=1 Tax=Malassezia brasiliensis TaxID=1821822 RepID=A0AAF0DPC4_9BASI|nr:hypothetical protein MBRA1_000098 [Malassezia brasiliensis]
MRYHVSSSSLRKYLEQYPEPRKEPATLPPSLESLLDALSSRAVKGNEAKEMLRAFLLKHQILPSREPSTGSMHPTSPLLDLFYRCLDRNLKAGISQNSLRDTLASTQAHTRTKQFLEVLRTTGSVNAFPMDIALAHIATPKRLQHLHKHTSWFVSRKLDGIRCIMIATINWTQRDPRVTHLDTLSRTGRPLTSLASLRTQLVKDLVDYPDLAALCGTPDSHGMTHLVLDGELCALRPTEDARGDGYVEDFLHTLSVVRRHTDSQTPIVFFPFDAMPLDAFVCWRTYLEQGRARPLQARLAALQAWVAWCLAHQPATCVRRLEQVRVPDVAPEDVTIMLAQAIEKRWEGLIMRADGPYEGRRSNAMLKLRPTQEAEYVVREAVVSQMRLPLDGHYEERPALSHVVIKHKGEPVSVGSGFSVAERLRYGAHPEELRGKVVTVIYYQESTKDQSSSLRFPIVKGVYDTARRTL